jgi:hypothetical protein
MCSRSKGVNGVRDVISEHDVTKQRCIITRHDITDATAVAVIHKSGTYNPDTLQEIVNGLGKSKLKIAWIEKRISGYPILYTKKS